MRSFKNGQNSGARRNRDEIYPAESKKMKIAESRFTPTPPLFLKNRGFLSGTNYHDWLENDFNDDG